MKRLSENTSNTVDTLASVFNTATEFAKIGTVSAADCPNVTSSHLRLPLPSTRISSTSEIDVQDTQDAHCLGIRCSVVLRGDEKRFEAATLALDAISKAMADFFPFHWRSAQDSAPIPKLNIVIMVIGSRGDIQPFVEISRILKYQYGHRVRIATHPNFRKLVADECGLEHFSVGGDPAQLMAFMVKNPGMLPQMETLRSGEIGRRRAEMRGMFEKFWKACIEPGPDGSGSGTVPFVADAIIANPPALVHAHCAERLGCHLHVMFTFPYTPTKAFPHPLATTKASDGHSKRKNLLSYHLVDSLTWQGLGDLVNKFRRDTLGLEDVSTIYAASNVGQIAIPWTYLWSPGLVPKPHDWGENIRVVGFPFLDLATSFEPDQALTSFLAAGDAPLYIGFGSIVMEDADAFLEMIIDAVRQLGVRAVISSGWADFAESKQPENIIFVKDVPHDWLFPRCCAVVHHGGAGTTAVGLKCGLPTVIAPFFGDQAFWGSVVSAAAAGAQRAVKRKELTTELLIESIRQCLTDEAKDSAQRIATAIAQDGSGAINAVDHFHEALLLEGRESWRCDMFKDRLAVWDYQHRGKLKLSALAAEVMSQQRKIRQKDLKLFRHREWNEIQGRNDPFTGGFSAIYDLFNGLARELARGPKSVRKFLIRPGERSHRQNEMQPAAHSADLPKDFLAAVDQSQRPAQVNRCNDQPPEHMAGAAPASAAHASEKQQAHNVDLESGNAHNQPHTIYMVLLEFTSSLLQILVLLLQFSAFFLANIADGFHNLPRVYGDQTVRPQLRITGFKSGLRAGFRELFLGTWDALIGPLQLPVHDVRIYGFLGLLTGLAKSIAGLVCKPSAALFGFPGYTLKGLARSMRRHSTSSGIRARRLALGRMEMARLEPWEQDEAKNAAVRMRKPWYSGTWKLMPRRDPKEKWWWRRRRVRKDDQV